MIQTRRQQAVGTVTMSLGMTLLLVSSAATWADQPATQPAPLKVLMVVGGVAHDYQGLPARLADRLNKSKDLRVEVTADLGDLAADKLGQYDALVFNCCLEAELDEAQRKAIVESLRKGKGLVAVHCAFWSFQKWPAWRQITGALVLGHDPYGPFESVVVDRRHPITQGVPLRFKVMDEPYLAAERGDHNHVLVETAKPHGGRDKPEPMAWTTRYAGGRVFSIMFGHDDQVQSEPAFLTLLANGIRWSAGRLPPPTLLSEAEAAEGFVPLFDGKGLAGWRYEPRLWKVKEGIIIGNSHPAGLEANSFAIFDKPFADFVLRFSVKLVSGNSGVQFRSVEGPAYTVSGYQADVVLLGWGNLHEQDGRRRLIDGWTGKAEHNLDPDGWNDMEVIADGPHIVLKTNGVVTADWTEPDASRPKAGIIALQLHRGEPMEVHFTNIRIRPIRP